MFGRVDGRQDVLHDGQRAERGDQHHQMRRPPPLEPSIELALDQCADHGAGDDGQRQRRQLRHATPDERPGDVAAHCIDAGMGNVENLRCGIDE
jgi:hypothetical protein